MALEGELLGLAGITCECGRKLPLEIQVSPAGYYLGYLCQMCGPISRETHYFRTRELAEGALDEVDHGIKPAATRDTQYHGR